MRETPRQVRNEDDGILEMAKFVIFIAGVILGGIAGATASGEAQYWSDAAKIADARRGAIKDFVLDAAQSHENGNWSESDIAAMRALAKGRSVMANVKVISPITSEPSALFTQDANGNFSSPCALIQGNHPYLATDDLFTDGVSSHSTIIAPDKPLEIQ